MYHNNTFCETERSFFRDRGILLIFYKVTHNLLLLNVYNVAHKQITEKDEDESESTNGID